jgi:acylphosphatase
MVRGRVQGVFFRRFAQEHARKLGFKGWVRNLSDGATVEVVAEGDRNRLDSLIGLLRKGPPGSWVEKVETQLLSPEGHYGDFTIRG